MEQKPPSRFNILPCEKNMIAEFLCYRKHDNSFTYAYVHMLLASFDYRTVTELNISLILHF